MRSALERQKRGPVADYLPWPSNCAWGKALSTLNNAARRDASLRPLPCAEPDARERPLRVTNRLMRVIPRFGYRLTEFACLAAASKATRAANLVFPCKPDGYLLGSYRIA